jgi:hypothetical protein
VSKINDNGPDSPPEAPTEGERTDGPAWTSGRLAFRCTLPYAVWAHGLGQWARIPTSEVADQALRRYADQLGYPPPQPPRLPSDRAFIPTHQLQADFRGSRSRGRS